MSDLIERFKTGLHELHRGGDVDPLVELFAEDAILSKAGLPHGERGREGAQTFWRNYRDVFGSIESTFHNVVSGDGIAFLEWTSTGTLRDGEDFRYEGVSVLEGDGESIGAFRTYYDTAAFLSDDIKPRPPGQT